MNDPAQTTEMRAFRMKADVVFDAEDIVDAFKRLAEHFEAMADSQDSDLFEPESSIEIMPMRNVTNG